MMEIANLTKSKIPEKKLQCLAKRILDKEKKKGIVSIAIVGEKKMRQLNKAYCNKDYAASVLSFTDDSFALGEIVLCPLEIRKDALKYKIPFKRAISWMFVHGLLHLLGYTHKTIKEEKIMTKKEQTYLSFIK